MSSKELKCVVITIDDKCGIRILHKFVKHLVGLHLSCWGTGEIVLQYTSNAVFQGITLNNFAN